MTFAKKGQGNPSLLTLLTYLWLVFLVKLVLNVHVQRLQTNASLCFHKVTLLFHTVTLAFLNITVTSECHAAVESKCTP